MATMSGFLMLGLAAYRVTGAVTLFNDAQEVLFPNAPKACTNALAAKLECDTTVQKLTADLDKLAPSESDLLALCTDGCSSSLRDLKASVQQQCTGFEFYFNDDYWRVEDVVDLFQYKFGSVCLRDSDKNFCLVVEETWDVGALDKAGKATWPAYSNKTFPNWAENGDGEPTRDTDGELVDDSIKLPKFTLERPDLPDSPSDFYFEAIPVDWIGHGWDSLLEFDEYPLEIQCSECFLSQYKYGLESKWGNIFDEVAIQVWQNMQQNCKIDWDLKPAHNYSQHGIQHNITALVWDTPWPCDQQVTRDDTTTKTCGQLSLQWSIPSASLQAFNDITCASVRAGTFCIPIECGVAVVSKTMDARSFLENYDNVTMTQFMDWNPFANSRLLSEGDVVCVAPPGGTYSPISTSVQPSTTTFKQPGSTSTTTTTSTTSTVNNGVTTPTPTQPSLVKNCAKFYYVKKGDSCYDIAKDNGITMEDFEAWNPKVGSSCGGLWADNYACVGILPAINLSTYYHDNCSGDKHNDVSIAMNSGGQCVNTDCDVASLDLEAAGTCPDGEVRISYWEGDNCAGGKWFGYGYTSRGTCKALWSGGWSFRSMYISCAKKSDDCVTKGECIVDPEPTKGICSTDGGQQPAFSVKSHSGGDCSGAVHNDVAIQPGNGMCIDTDCQVASLDTHGLGDCPDGEIRISYWGAVKCAGAWYGYGYADRNTCRTLWSGGAKFKSLWLSCAKRSDDCVSNGECNMDPEPANSLC